MRLFEVIRWGNDSDDPLTGDPERIVMRALSLMFLTTLLSACAHQSGRKSS